MDSRFPTLLPQQAIRSRHVAQTLPLPSLPYMEWLIAAAVLLIFSV